MIEPVLSRMMMPTVVIASPVACTATESEYSLFGMTVCSTRGIAAFALRTKAATGDAEPGWRSTSTALAVMGIQLGYLLGGSILIETVFSWPGTGGLLNAAIFQRDLPLLQGTILVLALFFVILNLIVDVMQTMLDPRIQRS